MQSARTDAAEQTLPRFGSHEDGQTPKSGWSICFTRFDPHIRFRYRRNHQTNRRLQVGGTRAFTRAQSLFAPGDVCETIYCLTDGWIATYDLLANGRRQILSFALPGTILGFTAAGRTVAANGAEALNRAAVRVLPRNVLEVLARQHPNIGIEIAQEIARDRSLCLDHLTSIGRRSANARVARLLLELFVRSRSRWPRGRIEEVLLPLTQEHIGDATGLSSVHVNRVLNDLKRDAILSFRYRMLTILDADKLVAAAEIDPQQRRPWDASSVPRRLQDFLSTAASSQNP